MYTPSSARAGALFREHEKSVYQRTDQMFFYLLLLQWAAAVVVAVVVSPYTWIGASQRVNEHVWIAVLLGGAVVSLPACMARYHAGHAVTRHVIAVGHMLMVGMLVHLSGGRIETHFHYFGSLAFLSFYRDWRILLTATLVAGTEHLLRGIYWPLSIYGVLTASPWRTLEHVWWVLLEDVVLVIAISQNVRAMGQIAERQAGMEAMQASVEQQVIERTEELRREVAERRNAEECIGTVAEELKRSNKELESFASVASHDLQEPLRKILAFSERLRRKLGDALSSEAAEDMDRIQNAATRMQRLIEDLLTYSRVTTKAKPFVAVDLNVIAREVLGDLEIRIEKSEATVDLAPLPTIQADATQMRQLLQNLLANALKFKQPEVPPRIRVGCQALESGAHAISVIDNGIGFEEKYSERIFGVFQRLHDQKQYEGTGIGLAVCKKIAERHGGSIVAHSAGPGRGATIRVTLPNIEPA